MTKRRFGKLLRGALACLGVAWWTGIARADEPPTGPEARAVAFLAAEVPRWADANHCFSCHNNGDAARALITAVKLKAATDRKPLESTLQFLAQPEQWDANGPDGPFKDQRLARLQFAAALAGAHDARLLVATKPLTTAAALVAELQTPDGSWSFDAAGNVGSPVTYGPALSTHTAVKILSAADAVKYRSAIDKARQWLRTTRVANVLAASAALWALANDSGTEVEAQRARCRTLIAVGESPTGGWGPFVNSPPEVFDTAVVLLALAAQVPSRERDAWIEHGRKYLLAAQSADGSWPATTRPSGVESYSQQVSTTAWALEAVLATRPKPPEMR